ncbi:hypothetical protein BTHE_1994 [Bifidobacterium thermophilum]|nr:hypothetical protein BTHE_1994 [Bifidobacterium thermophilum]
MRPKPEVSARRVTHRSHHSQIPRENQPTTKLPARRVSQSSHKDQHDSLTQSACANSPAQTLLTPRNPSHHPDARYCAPYCRRIISVYSSSAPKTRRSSQTRPPFAARHFHQHPGTLDLADGATRRHRHRAYYHLAAK